MDLPAKYIINSTLKVGVVYKLVAPELITTDVPHYFVVVAINDDNNYMLLSTTQYEKKIEHLSRRQFDLDTLVQLVPSENNGFECDSYFNCNDYYSICKNSLEKKVLDKQLEIKGNVTREEYLLLVDGIKLSYINDMPKFLLQYP